MRILEEFLSHRYLPSGPIAAYVTSSLTKEPVMGSIARVIPGLAAGLIARHAR
jgi:hypothetical protein